MLKIKKRAQLFRSWGSIREMLPKGGSLFWENIVSFKDKNIGTDDLISFLKSSFEKDVGNLIDRDNSVGILNSSVSIKKYDELKYFSNPLESELPNSPSLTIHCLYGKYLSLNKGVGKDVEGIEINKTSFLQVKSLHGREY
jgi:hypothetical protein